ncbi:MAG: 4Fe-4S binding protein [Thermodesulfovibrionales bacterium]|nr:4Fe-4S binding protein [Thermodesulfovibrionales bacterium]
MNITRRDFIKSFFVFSFFSSLSISKTVASSSFERQLQPLPHIDIGGVIRPPGAVEENIFRSKCISCGVCVNICHVMKYNSIAISGIKNIKNFGTPFIKDMRDFPCALCMECPKYCPTGALQKIDKEKVTMGMALIDFNLCFGWNGDVCLSCSKACPMGAKIFDFYHGQWGNQPYINENCVGCGLCVKHCPLGGSAVKVITRQRYQTVKTEYLTLFKGLLEMPLEQRYNLVYTQNLPEILARGRIIEREYR